MQRPVLSLFSITGHVQGKLPIPANGAGAGYIDVSLASPLGEKSELLNQLDYGLTFYKA